jgi:hypothetical protein
VKGLEEGKDNRIQDDVRGFGIGNGNKTALNLRYLRIGGLRSETRELKGFKSFGLRT